MFHPCRRLSCTVQANDLTANAEAAFQPGGSFQKKFNDLSGEKTSVTKVVEVKTVSGSTTTPPPPESSGLGTGALVAIIVGGVVVVAVVLALLVARAKGMICASKTATAAGATKGSKKPGGSREWVTNPLDDSGRSAARRMSRVSKASRGSIELKERRTSSNASASTGRQGAGRTAFEPKTASADDSAV